MNLREARFFKRLNQWDISIKTGISQSRLSLIEREYVDPKYDEKKKIARVLGCQINEIFPQMERVSNG